MSLLQRLRSVLGLDGSGNDEIEEPPAVTVEHPREPEETPTSESPPDVPETSQSDSMESEEATAPRFEHDGPTTDISGIGPAYSERLSQAGIDSIGDLAAADPGGLAEELDLTEGRVSAWVEDARDLASTE